MNCNTFTKQLQQNNFMIVQIVNVTRYFIQIKKTITNDFVTYNTLRLAGRVYLSYPFDKRDGFSFPFQRNLNGRL